ncbi:CoA transferase subunit A [Dactylosporangium sucinum]|uniref:CoA-transferase n=1 Tax=Dactylosporangium sucinum TaxID=1424081 RepID=A0A917X4V2_9ACTN|nr:CoA transferase subunit A [Dactylosporangium sucinum]GGM75093.1 CoA-transferase [Dactylosporangium sucinum]
MRDKVVSAEQAVALIADGDVVGLQAGPTQCAPMTLVREIIRAGRRDLSLVCLSGGLPVDWLAAAGALARCTFAAVTMEHFGLCQRFRRGVETGAIAVEELSETALYARLGAASRGLPFLPTRGLIGTDLLDVGNDALKVIPDPFGGPPVVACRALRPDVAVLHAHRADRAGNIGIDPGVRLPTLTTMPRASRRVIVSVERIVGSAELRRAPDRTILPGFAVDAVVEAPFGAHPTSLFPVYDYDAGFFAAWVEAAADDDACRAFVDRYVRSPATQQEYLALVGER